MILIPMIRLLGYKFQIYHNQRQTKNIHDGKEKSLFISFCADTCIRKAASLKLKWSKFKVKEDGVYIDAIDKGNKEFKSKIHKDFYEKLLSLKTNKSKFVFSNLTVSAIDVMLDQ